MIPMVPTFSPKVFVPFPLPQRPAKIVPNPSIPMPRLIAWTGGGGAPKIYENLKTCFHIRRSFKKSLEKDRKTNYTVYTERNNWCHAHGTQEVLHTCRITIVKHVN